MTSASVVIFGEAIWDPVVLLSKLEHPLVILVSLFALLIATLTTNVAANVVAPANGFANLWPRADQLRDRRADHRRSSAS